VLRGTKGRSFPPSNATGWPVETDHRQLRCRQALDSVLHCRELEDGSFVLLARRPGCTCTYGIVSLRAGRGRRQPGDSSSSWRDAERDTAQDEQRLARRFGDAGHA